MTVRGARFVLLLLLAATVQAKPDATAKYKAKLAKVWVDYSRWLKLKGLKTAADEALARARAADPANKDLARLAADIEALEGRADADPGLEARRKKAHKDAAKIYDRLAKIDETEAKQIKLRKLGLKDRMEAIARMHRQEQVPA